MRPMLVAGLVLAGAMTTGVLAQSQHHPASRAQTPGMGEMCAKCPMCSGMMARAKSRAGVHARTAPGTSTGTAGGMMADEMMAGAASTPPTTLTVGADGTVYVLRDNTLYKYDSGLNLIGQATLPDHAPPHEH